MLAGEIIAKRNYRKKRYSRKNDGDDLLGKIIVAGFAIFLVLSLAIYILENYWPYLLLVGIAYLVYAHGPYCYSKFKARNASVVPESYEVINVVDDIEIEEEIVDDEDNTEKGDMFERFVVDLFSEQSFTIVEWTTDMMRKHDRYVEADTRPDLKLRHKQTGAEFYVECKYRSYIFENKVQWSSYGQMQRYREFADKMNLPVFVVIGLGGMPDYPERLFCIPLEDAKYTGLYPSYLGNYEHNPREYFRWKSNVLN